MLKTLFRTSRTAISLTRGFANVVASSTFCTFPSPGLEMLRNAGHNVKVLTQPGASIEEDRLIKECADADAIITIVSDPINRKVLEALKKKKLKMVAAHAVGLDNVDLKAAKELGIWVCHTPGVLTDAVADQAFGFILALARHIPQADQYSRQGKWKRIFEPGLFLGKQLRDSNLCILGLGRIGKGVAERAIGFGMNVFYHDPIRISPKEETDLKVTYVPTIEELIPKADFLLSLTPLLPETRHIINADRLNLMKKSAYFINNSRGPVVDEAALITHLKDGKIAGAGIDVFEVEPNIPKELRNMNNVILAPHLGSATWESRGKMNIMVAESIIACMDGKPIPHLAPIFKN